MAGPYTTVASFPMGGGPKGNYEDPQVAARVVIGRAVVFDGAFTAG